MTIKSNMGRRCIIRNSNQVRELLVKEFNRLGLSNKSIVDRARSEGEKFNESSFSRFTKSGNVRNSLTTEQIMYLCDVYGIELTLTAKMKKK